MLCQSKFVKIVKTEIEFCFIKRIHSRFLKRNGRNGPNELVRGVLLDYLPESTAPGYKLLQQPGSLINNT